MKKIFLIMSVFLVLASTAFADKRVWEKKNYDFSKIRNIEVELQIPERFYDGIIENAMPEIFEEKLNKNLIDKLPEGEYVIKNKTFNGFNDDFSSFEPCDARLVCRVLNCGIGSTVEKNLVETNYGAYISDLKFPVAVVSVSFMLEDVRTGKCIWSLNDSRERKEEFRSAKPVKVFRRICETGFNKLCKRLVK